MAPQRADAVRYGLLAGGGIALLAGIAAAYFAWRKADDFSDAASELDRRVNGREQIVTLASIVGPGKPIEEAARRTPLFPILWRHSTAALSNIDIQREFPLNPARPIGRSAGFAALALLAMAIATMGLVRMPAPEQILASKLRAIAEEVAKPGAGPADLALANSIRDATDALENPTLPPEERKKRIEEAMQQAARASEKRHTGNSGKEHGTGKTESGESGSNAGESKSKPAEGKGESAGNQGPANNGNGSSQNNGQGKNDRGNQQSIELKNDLAKAEAQIEADSEKNHGSGDKNAAGGTNKQAGPKPGENPNQPGAGQGPNPNAPGQAPEQAKSGDRNIPNPGGNSGSARNRGSSRGDTHLGEMPAPGNFQRFLKPGEKGAALGIHDARYVTFRIPAANPSGIGGGETVLDASRPRASTPYVNAPLPPMRSDAPPDERQLIPPRYRGMIE